MLPLPSLFLLHIYSHCLTCFSLFHCFSFRLSCHHLSGLLLLKAELLQRSNRNQNSKPFNELVAAVTKSTIFVASHPPPFCLRKNSFRFCKVLSALLLSVELGEPKTAIASGTIKKWNCQVKQGNTDISKWFLNLFEEILFPSSTRAASGTSLESKDETKNSTHFDCQKQAQHPPYHEVLPLIKKV